MRLWGCLACPWFVILSARRARAKGCLAHHVVAHLQGKGGDTPAAKELKTVSALVKAASKESANTGGKKLKRMEIVEDSDSESESEEEVIINKKKKSPASSPAAAQQKAASSQKKSPKPISPSADGKRDLGKPISPVSSKIQVRVCCSLCLMRTLQHPTRTSIHPHVMLLRLWPRRTATARARRKCPSTRNRLPRPKRLLRALRRPPLLPPLRLKAVRCRLAPRGKKSALALQIAKRTPYIPHNTLVLTATNPVFLALPKRLCNSTRRGSRRTATPRPSMLISRSLPQIKFNACSAEVVPIVPLSPSCTHHTHNTPPQTPTLQFMYCLTCFSVSLLQPAPCRPKSCKAW